MGEQVLALVGTRKGAFLFRSDRARSRWEADGPFFAGTECPHITYDPRDGSLYAAVNAWQYGPTVQRSTDMGKTWTVSSEGLKYAPDDPEKVTKVWHVEPGPASDPGVVYAGVEASGLFRSEDYGKTWQEVAALRQHPTHEKWAPGGGGKCLHTIEWDEHDPRRLFIACSAGGLYRTEDSGKSWRPCNMGILMPFMPEGQQEQEAGQCVHRFNLAPSRPGRVYLQHHGGVYRSDNYGDSWTRIDKGLPSDFGFALVAHPHKADRAYLCILNGDMKGRWMPDGQMTVWRTDDAGASWQPMRQGLPSANAYLTVLREGMAFDGADPLGLYVGTTAGQVFHSADEGESWAHLAENLPGVLGVSAAAVG